MRAPGQSVYVLFICSLLFPLSLLAQAATDTINTDRPDQTEAPFVVRAGSLQIEAGFMLNPFDSSGGKLPMIGMAVLRYGMSKRLELRLMAEEGRERDRFLSETTQGVYPLAIGGKVLLLEQDGILPRAALLAWMKLPFTSRSSSQSVYWSPQVLLAFEHELSDKLELEYNIGGKQAPYRAEWEWMGSTSIHVGISERMTLFLEYFGQYGAGADPVHNADCGLLFLVSPSLQLDISVGRSISAPEEQQNSFGAVGFAIRLPH